MNKAMFGILISFVLLINAVELAGAVTVNASYYCNDSDGDDIYAKGHLFSDIQGVILNDVNRNLSDIEDFCTPRGKYGTNLLVEFTCSSPSAHLWGPATYMRYNDVHVNYISCTWGCRNGACIKEKSCRDFDINKDNVIDMADLGILVSFYNQRCQNINSYCNGSDLNEDGRVDVGDLGILSAHYGEFCM